LISKKLTQDQIIKNQKKRNQRTKRKIKRKIIGGKRQKTRRKIKKSIKKIETRNAKIINAKDDS
jgi:hypothetical protein